MIELVMFLGGCVVFLLCVQLSHMFNRDRPFDMIAVVAGSVAIGVPIASVLMKALQWAFG